MANSTSNNKRHETPQNPETDPISLALRQLWAAVEMEPVPEDFLRLLDDLDNPAASEKKPDTKKDSR